MTSAMFIESLEMLYKRQRELHGGLRIAGHLVQL